MLFKLVFIHVYLFNHTEPQWGSRPRERQSALLTVLWPELSSLMIQLDLDTGNKS